MKKMLLMLLVLTTASCGGGKWEKKAEYKTSFPFTMAGFINDDCGITVGMFGEVHSTKNGGKEWPKIPEFNDKYAIDALATGQFIHAGFAGKVGIIADGETSEPLESPISGIVMLVNFLDEQTGCAVNKLNDIKFTADGGNTWQDIQKPETMGIIISIDLYSKNGICVLDNTGRLYVTNDGGANWKKTALPVEKYIINFRELKPYSASMRFSDESNGTIAIIAPAKEAKKSSVLVYKTVDGAKPVIADEIRCGLNAGSKLFLSPDSSYLTVSGDDAIILFKGMD